MKARKNWGKTVFIIWTKCFDDFFLKLKIPKFPYLDDHVHDQSQPLHLKHLEVPKVGANGAQKAQMTAKSFWFQRFLFFFIPHCQLINNHVFWANFSTRWFHEIINFVLFFSHCTEQSELRPTCAAALKNWALWWELTTDQITEMTLRQGPTLSKQRIGH